MRKVLLTMLLGLICMSISAQKWHWNGRLAEAGTISDSNYPKSQPGTYFAIFQIARADGKPMPNTKYTLTARATYTYQNGKLLVQVPTSELSSRNKFAITCPELGAIAFDYQVAKVKKQTIYALTITDVVARSIGARKTEEDSCDSDTTEGAYDSEAQFQMLLSDPEIQKSLGL